MKSPPTEAALTDIRRYVALCTVKGRTILRLNDLKTICNAVYGWRVAVALRQADDPGRAAVRAPKRFIPLIGHQRTLTRRRDQSLFKTEQLGQIQIRPL
jgi:hypothetical protein